MVLLDYSQEPIASEEDIADSLGRLNRYFLHRAKYSYGIGVEVAEELIQDAFIRVYSSVKSGKLIHQRGLPNFLKMIFDNLCKDCLKSRQNRIFSNCCQVENWTRPSRKTPLDEIIEEESLEPLVEANNEINRLKGIYSPSAYHKKSKTIREGIRVKLHI